MGEKKFEIKAADGDTVRGRSNPDEVSIRRPFSPHADEERSGVIKPRRSPSRRPSSPKAMAATKTLSRALGIVRVRFEAAWRALRHTPPFSWRLRLLRSTKGALSHSYPNVAAVARLARALPRPDLPPPDLAA